MKLPLVLAVTLVFLVSCMEKNHCDTTDYAQPEITILDPADGVIVIPWEGKPDSVRLNFKAPAGLNNLKLADPWGYEQEVHLFTGGETESTISFEFLYGYEGKNTFVLYDLCDQRTEQEVTVVFEQAPDS